MNPNSLLMWTNYRFRKIHCFYPSFLILHFYCRRKPFFLSNGNIFLNESFIPAIGEEFFSLMETVTLLERFFLLAETVTAMSGNQFYRQNLFLLVETNFPTRFSSRCLIYVSRSPSSQLAEAHFILFFIQSFLSC